MACGSLIRTASIVVPAVLCLVPRPGLARTGDPTAVLTEMAQQPLRYGGEMSGKAPGRLLVAISRPDADGKIRGRAMLLTSDRRLIATGAVTGRWQPEAVPGGHACGIKVALGSQSFSLNGVCSATTLSGEVTSSVAAAGWLTRQIVWWPRRETTGWSWMTQTTFTNETR